MMNKIYIVKYCGGSYEDWYSTNIFATTAGGMVSWGLETTNLSTEKKLIKSTKL